MRISLLLLITGCYIAHLSVHVRSSVDHCNTPNYQCSGAEPSGPDDSASSGTVNCLSNGTLHISIRFNDEWRIENLISVVYTCQSQYGQEITNGVVWNQTSIYPSITKWLNKTVDIVHHHINVSECSVHSCYSNRCSYYGIAMDNTNCKFKAELIPIRMAETQSRATLTSLHQNNLISPTSSYLLTVTTTKYTPTISKASIFASNGLFNEYDTSFGPQQQSTKTTELFWPTSQSSSYTLIGKPMNQITTSSGIEVVVVPVMMICFATVTLVVSLMLFLGFKHHKLNKNKVYDSDEGFNPYFYPIDVGEGIKINTAQSTHSIYESLKTNHQPDKHDSATEDETSEILDSATLSDSSSKISIVSCEHNSLNLCQPENFESRKLTYSTAAFSDSCYDEHQKMQLLSTHAKFDHACTTYVDGGQQRFIGPLKFPNRALSHSSSSSGYVSENEMPQLPCQMSKSAFLNEVRQDIQRSSRELVTSDGLHSSIPMTLHMHPLNTVYYDSSERNFSGLQTTLLVVEETQTDEYNIRDDRRRMPNTPRKRTKQHLSNDIEIHTTHPFVAVSDKEQTNEDNHHQCSQHQELSMGSVEVLPESNLSLNPSHFEPIDYNILCVT